jgi:methylmalonyl-CoA mutase N-terminal domain/subunit
VGHAHVRRPLQPAESNALYRRNLAKGQTGLSVAFDLPTQTGYDPDHELARGEVGKVGVPVSHIGDMRALFDGIPLTGMNTSMTINAPAMWLLALYQVAALEQAEHEHARRPAGGASSTPRPSSPRSPAPRRTTSSRSTSRAGRTCSRRARASA